MEAGEGKGVAQKPSNKLEVGLSNPETFWSLVQGFSLVLGTESEAHSRAVITSRLESFVEASLYSIQHAGNV